MSILDNRKLIKILFIILDFILFLGIMIVIATPFVFQFIPSSVFNILFFGNSYYLSLISFELAFVFIWLILNELRKIFRNIVRNNFFIRANVVHLRRIAGLSLLIGAILAVKCFLDFTFFTPVFAFIAGGVGIFFAILAGVMLKSVELSNENSKFV